MLVVLERDARDEYEILKQVNWRKKVSLSLDFTVTLLFPVNVLSFWLLALV